MALKLNLDPRTNPRLRRVLTWVAYPVLYLTLFLLFAYWSFPYDRLKQRIAAGYNSSQAGKPDAKHMVIGDVTWAWRFPGVVLSDVELIGPKPAAAAEGEKAPPRDVVAIEEVYAGFSILSALVGGLEVDFDVTGFGGELEGQFAKSGETLELQVELDGVDPGQLPGVREALQLPMTGQATGSASLSIPEGKYADAEGNVEIEVENLEVGDGKTKIRDLLALPTVKLGTLKVAASVTKGRVKLEAFEAKGNDLDVSAEGRMRLRDPFATSVVESVSLAFKFSDKYRDKDDTTRSLLGKPGDKVGGVLDLDPNVKRAKGEDGFYRWRVAGSIAKPSFRPDSRPPGAKGARAPAAPELEE